MSAVGGEETMGVPTRGACSRCSARALLASARARAHASTCQGAPPQGHSLPMMAVLEGCRRVSKTPCCPNDGSFTEILTTRRVSERMRCLMNDLTREIIVAWREEFCQLIRWHA